MIDQFISRIRRSYILLTRSLALISFLRVVFECTTSTKNQSRSLFCLRGTDPCNQKLHIEHLQFILGARIFPYMPTPAPSEVFARDPGQIPQPQTDPVIPTL